MNDTVSPSAQTAWNQRALSFVVCASKKKCRNRGDAEKDDDNEVYESRGGYHEESYGIGDAYISQAAPPTGVTMITEDTTETTIIRKIINTTKMGRTRNTKNMMTRSIKRTMTILSTKSTNK
ncbi:MAG: hypothetical protein ISR54_03355 [Chlorobium phaeobacteroides]|nr:hypothetical protein [Chlorobium phaeobacteroides]MBL6955848.1 hypothetical protein [Chlorobium phaeobacteroides]